jgi:7-cyano-7-deazaguanine synthase
MDSGENFQEPPVYDAVCLASGGLDSVTCLHLLRQRAISALPVFVNYGQKNLDQEFASLVRNTQRDGFPEPIVVDLSGFGKVIRTGLTDPSKRVLEDAFTPNRNLLFLVVAASVAYTKGISSIVVGLLAEKTAIFPDQGDRFLSAAECAITESLGVQMRVLCPLRDMVKTEVVLLAQHLGVKSSYSCHSGASEPCGKCIACLEYNKEE